ncbi:MAG: hypothetical protein HY674_07905, partial [Chloroflexi bacterium]|nr:hypothetical protein [Chloroflexota bacterium]
MRRWPGLGSAVGWFLGFAVVLLSSLGQEPPRLSALAPDTNGWMKISAADLRDRVYTIQASSDLTSWNAIATLHGAPLYRFSYSDAAAPEFGRRFYQAISAAKTEADDWKNQIVFPDDPFLAFSSAGGPDAIRWIKFSVLLGEPARVYFQNSTKYVFHYDFAAARLAPFKGASREEFDRVSLRLQNQQVILGSVLFPPSGKVEEYGIQFVGLDAYPRETIGNLFQIVKSAVVSAPSVQGFYMPAFEQTALAEAERAFFVSNGIPITSPDRWIAGNTCYSPGWALGRLKFIRAAEINAAYADGRLLPQDVLLTDGIPAEIPYVAGIITLAPSTLNSHVAILA